MKQLPRHVAPSGPLAGSVSLCLNGGNIHSRIGGAAIAFTVILAGCSGISQSNLSPGDGSLTPSLRSQPTLGRQRGARALWTETVLYSFADSPDGAIPGDTMTDVNGTLYGTTRFGGSGAGTVFSITPSGTYSLLHSFGGIGQAKVPFASVTNVNVTLFGTTSRGGTHNEGTVYKITKSGAAKVLYSFAGGSDAAIPFAGLTNVGGTLYGTSTQGGANGVGTVFKVTKNGTETVLYSFAGGTDGAGPSSGLTNVNGTLYGTTQSGGTGCGSAGCGTVFSITTSGMYRQLHSFSGGPIDGATPVYGSLIKVNGRLYGTTSSGGANGLGTVFSIKTSGAYNLLYSFANIPDGGTPVAGLTNVGNTLYGTTNSGGANGDGTVFSITTSGTETVLYSFAGSPDGANPAGGLTNVNGTLYGTTELGGSGGKAIVHHLLAFAVTLGLRQITVVAYT